MLNIVNGLFAFLLSQILDVYSTGVSSSTVPVKLSSSGFKLCNKESTNQNRMENTG